ncbi:MAG: rRNA adenine N-6-methyltransferase family protein [Pseudomonadota bacterium]
MTETIEMARRWFAEDLRAVVPVRDDRVVDAFATVPRERFLGPGPWRLHSRMGGLRMHLSADADPRHLYHDVLVAIDAVSGINNGQPSLWAMVFDALAVAPGETVLQVGAGTGYYTAILAELVGPTGRVVSFEVEPRLAERAAAALTDRANVEIVLGDATLADLPKLDVVVACAGVTHVPETWRGRLAKGGRMVLPVTGARSWGFLMKLDRGPDGMPVRSLGPCGFYPCEGARRDGEAAAWDEILAARRPVEGTYRLGVVPDGREAMVAGDGWWIGG